MKAILAALLVMASATAAATAQDLERPICMSMEAWANNAPESLRYITTCGPRSWWHSTADPAIVFKTNVIGGKVCITGQYYIPPIGERHVCPADRKGDEAPS